ncbi:MAG: alginate export family protein [Gemmatimonadetes bacterium]|nr:alginate export family protein [Gemmatimonadota bacterium]
MPLASSASHPHFRSPILRLARSLALACLLARPIAARAQAIEAPHAPDGSAPTSDAARPAYESVRYREDWSQAPHGDLFDPLKHITLGEHTWLSVGGHVRGRIERDENYQGGGAGTRDNAFDLLRTHVHLDLHATDHLRGFVEGRIATARDRDLPGGIRTTDRDDGDILNAFVEVNRLPWLGAQWAVRYGRQELLFGRERIVSPADWSNVKRTFQGAVVEARGGGWLLTAFATHPVALIPAAMDVPDVHTAFWGAELTVAPPGGVHITDLFAYVKAVDAAGATPFTQRVTLGTRSVAVFPDSPFGYEVEGGVQVGAAGNTGVHAYMVDAEFNAALPFALAPSLAVGGGYASGSDAGATAQEGTWDQLFPLAHSYLGYADVLGRKNVIEERIVGTLNPARSVRLRLSIHAFQRANTADAIYDTPGAVLRAPGTSSARDIGGETDLTVQWRATLHLRIDGGFAHFTPGTFMRDTGSALSYSWMYAAVTATF